MYDRVKSPYPSTQDPRYARALQEQTKELLARPAHPVFDLVDRDRVREAAGARHRSARRRRGAASERTLDLAGWLDLYAPELVLS